MGGLRYFPVDSRAGTRRGGREGLNELCLNYLHSLLVLAPMFLILRSSRCLTGLLKPLLILSLVVSLHVHAAYRCTDGAGKISYQSSPCDPGDHTTTVELDASGVAPDPGDPGYLEYWVDRGKLAQGMTGEQVMRVLGPPASRKSVSGRADSSWIYGARGHDDYTPRQHHAEMRVRVWFDEVSGLLIGASAIDYSDSQLSAEDLRSDEIDLCIDCEPLNTRMIPARGVSRGRAIHGLSARTSSAPQDAASHGTQTQTLSGLFFSGMSRAQVQAALGPPSDTLRVSSSGREIWIYPAEGEAGYRPRTRHPRLSMDFSFDTVKDALLELNALDAARAPVSLCHDCL